MSLLKAYSGAKKNSPDRKENDFYPTPPVATFALMRKFFIPYEVHEPAAGRGHISHELQREGLHRVVSTDLYAYENTLVPVQTPHDFLELKQRIATGLVTNPPFKNDLPEKFIRHAIDLNYEFIAIFARLTLMESIRRYRLFQEHPPTDVLVLSGRVNCDDQYFPDKQLGGMVAYAWYVWSNNVKKPTQLRWVNIQEMWEEWQRSSSI